MVAHLEKLVLHFHSVDAWHEWLLENHANPDGVRLQLLKKGSSKPGIRYAEALDEALCFGWIDGQVEALDADYYLDGFSPRRARSVWSQVNCAHIERLTAEGRMQPSGLAAVEKAKADGRWDAAYRQKDATVPDDLRAALDANPAAAEFFATLSGQNRFAVLFRIGNVTRPSTRAAKISGFVTMLERHETIYPQRGTSSP